MLIAFQNCLFNKFAFNLPEDKRKKMLNNLLKVDIFCQTEAITYHFVLYNIITFLWYLKPHCRRTSGLWGSWMLLEWVLCSESVLFIRPWSCIQVVICPRSCIQVFIRPWSCIQVVICPRSCIQVFIRPASLILYLGSYPFQILYPGSYPSQILYPGSYPSLILYPGSYPSLILYPGSYPSQICNPSFILYSNSKREKFIITVLKS